MILNDIYETYEEEFIIYDLKNLKYNPELVYKHIKNLVQNFEIFC